MGDYKKKMILATLSKCISDRDASLANISFTLEKGCGNTEDNVSYLKDEFDKLSQSNLTIETIQLYYAQNFDIEDKTQKRVKKGKGEENDNNS
jgi:hypothetical protein